MVEMHETKLNLLTSKTKNKDKYNCAYRKRVINYTCFLGMCIIGKKSVSNSFFRRLFIWYFEVWKLNLLITNI